MGGGFGPQLSETKPDSRSPKLIVCVRAREKGRGQAQEGAEGGTFIKMQAPPFFLLLNPGGSPSPPPSLISSPSGVVGAASSEGYLAPFSPTRTRAPVAPDGCTLAHAGAHAQVVTHQGQRRRRQPEQAGVALRPPNLAIHLQSDPPPQPTPPGRPLKKKKKCLTTTTTTTTHTHTK